MLRHGPLPVGIFVKTLDCDYIIVMGKKEEGDVKTLTEITKCEIRWISRDKEESKENKRLMENDLLFDYTKKWLTLLYWLQYLELVFTGRDEVQR